MIASGFLFNLLVLYRAIPGFAAFPAQYLKQRNGQEYTADAEDDVERLRVFHALRARLTGDIKADNGCDGEND